MEQVDANVNLQTNAINLQAMHAASYARCTLYTLRAVRCTLHAVHGRARRTLRV